MASAAELLHGTPKPRESSHGNPLIATVIETQTSLGNIAQAYLSRRPLNGVDVESLLPTFFVNNRDALQATLSGLQDGLTVADVTQIRATSLQQGLKAQIVLFGVTVAETEHYFISYISRGAIGEDDAYTRGLAEETQADFDNLQTLSTLFRLQLTAKALGKYNVVMPLASGTVQHEGKNYPFFTMPFLPLGELHVFETRRERPYFTYAVDYDNAMTTESSQQEQRAESTRRTRWFERDVYEAQRQEVLTMLCLIYSVSGRLPNEFILNAGDLMTHMQNGILETLSLITVRGGFTPKLSEDEFIAWIKNHGEPREGAHHYPHIFRAEDAERRLFADMSETQIRRHLHKAKKKYLR